jgi:hypothetical protein
MSTAFFNTSGQQQRMALRHHESRQQVGHPERPRVGAQHPLVVAHHLLACRGEQPSPGRPAQRRLVHDPVVEPDDRQVRLRDRQVLVVAGVRDERLAPVRPVRPVPPNRGRSNPSGATSTRWSGKSTGEVVPTLSFTPSGA